MTGILGYLPYTIKSDEYAINIIIPRYKKFAKITPKRLSRINVGRKAKVTPRQEQIRFNNNYNQTIGQVLIDVAPGSQIVSKPFNPARINAPELAGATRTNLRFWLTDDEDRRVDTNSEYWTARIVIHYLKPYVIGEGK